MFGVPIPDLIVVAVYSILMLGIGMAAMFRVRNQEDYFLGGRRFGKVLQIFATFGQSTSADTAVGTITTTYRDGGGGMWSQLILLWATPLYWFMAPWYRRMRVLTLGDFFRERYQSRAMAMFYSAAACFAMAIIIALGLKAASVTVMGITLKPQSALTATEQAEYDKAVRWEILSEKRTLTAAETQELESLQYEKPRREFSYVNENWLVWSMVIIALIYGVAGGLEAAVWTQTVQGVLICVLSVILIPFGVAKLNSLHGASGVFAASKILHQELPGHFFSVFGSPRNADFTWYFIAVLSVMATLNVAVQSNQLTTSASARDEMAARVGSVTGTFIKRFCTVLWGAFGLLAYALYSREVQNSDLVYGHATRDLLGGAGFGLVGLMIACLLASLQSTVSTLMISSASLFTRNVYEPFFPGRSEAHYLLVGRVAGTVVLVASTVLCTMYDTVLELFKLHWEYNAILAAAFWCGLKWRRATRPAAWAAILTAFTLYIALPVALPLALPRLRTCGKLMACSEQQTVTVKFIATKRDVEDRQEEIAAWRGPDLPPPPLHAGDRATRAFPIAPKAIYWAQGIREVNGIKRAEGLFYPEMFLLGQMFDLTRNPNALNETIRYGFKITLPFLVLIAISLLTRADTSGEVRRLFVRMRVKVNPRREEDEGEVQAAYAEPDSTRGVLLFPDSQFEFFKWDRQDTLGFLAGAVTVFIVVGLVYAVLHAGV